MKKNKLPERWYYPIPEAAQYLGCSVRDVYHLCATNAINLSVYLRDIKSKDVGQIIFNPEGIIESNYFDDFIKKFSTRKRQSLNFEGTYIYGIHHEMIEHDELEYFESMDGYEYASPSLVADGLDGFFGIDWYDCFSLELSGGDFVEVSTVHTPSYIEDSVCLYIPKGLKINREALLIMARDIDNVYYDNIPNLGEKIEHPRTANRKGEIIPALLKMISEFGDVDVENEKAGKLADILVAAAASRGIELQMPDKNTWARYLGRTPECRRK